MTYTHASLFSGIGGAELAASWLGWTNVSMCTGGEIILEYQGSELDIKKAIELMEEVGYIAKDDFIL